MIKFARLAALAAAATIVATPAVAAPVGVTGQVPTASVRIVKPLTLTRVRDLNFGTIVVGTVTGTQTVGVTDAGVLTGCNSVLHPGAIVGRETQIYPGVQLRPGVYPESSIVKLRQELEVLPRA